MEIDEVIKQLERISHKLGSIGETVDYPDMAIEALKYKAFADIAIEALKYKAFADNAIKVLNNQLADERAEHQAKVQKCIDRLEATKAVNEFFGAKYLIDRAIEIIKEEMGVEESESSSIHEANQNS